MTGEIQVDDKGNVSEVPGLAKWRREIATQLAAAMLSGMAGANINPAYYEQFVRGVAQVPSSAVKMADAILAELSKEPTT